MPRAYFNAKKDEKKTATKKKSSGKKRPGYKDREDESLGERKGKKSQSFKDRRGWSNYCRCPFCSSFAFSEPRTCDSR